MVGVVQTRQGAVVRVIGQGAGQGRQHTRLGQTYMRTHRYSTADPHTSPTAPTRNQREQWQSSKESWFTFFWWLTLRASTRAAMSPQSSHPLYLVWVTGVPMNGSSTGDPAASYSTTYEGHGMTERGSVDLCATA
jgi:hypothetical protein